MSDEHYQPKEIEARWQRVWADERTWEATNDPDAPGVPAYVLEMLPYPSGEPHMGHLRNYALGDAMAHYLRRTGRQVLHPMGYDAFGLPAENHAITTGRHPRDTTIESIESFRRAFHDWGISIDWSREFGTHEPAYYRWTQWLFLRLFEHGLAYRKDAAVNWCPADATVLANEQVVDGRCERCDAEVEVRQLEQWFFRITDYADRLLDGLDTIDWPEHVKTMQRNWIGRSRGAQVTFRCEELDADFEVFTTRPDTLFGATFFVLAPEHPDVLALVDGTGREDEVSAYVTRAQTAGDEHRGAAERPKTGVFLGRYVTNPVNGARLPVYVADYVLMEYGTGAIMGVPAHDERDWAFAKAFDLPIRRVIAGGEHDVEHAPHTADGMIVGSHPDFDGMTSRDALPRVIDWLASEGRGRPATNYKLRDWLLSRQRYWGCPIPIIHCDHCGPVAVPQDKLPVVLPDVEDYAPKGRSPLAAAEEWVRARCPSCDRPGRRETDTMDTFVDSSWYFMRYCDPGNDDAFAGRAALDKWMPIDQYVGGVEHAVLHLLYARFFTKALHDLGHISCQEPFSRLFTQGMITKDGAKMSKNRGNGVDPVKVIDRTGADAARLYVLFMGPPDQDAEWTDASLGGAERFLSRLWRASAATAQLPSGPAPDPGGVHSDDTVRVMRKSHWAVRRVTSAVEGRFAFNAAIAAVMEVVNETSADKRGDADPGAVRFALRTGASLLFPFAPHISAEAYLLLTGERVWEQPWPEPDPAWDPETIEVVVQVDGKVRDRVHVPADATPDELAAAARALPGIASRLAAVPLTDTVVVPGRLVNFVVAPRDHV